MLAPHYCLALRGGEGCMGRCVRHGRNTSQAGSHLTLTCQKQRRREARWPQRPYQVAVGRPGCCASLLHRSVGPLAYDESSAGRPLTLQCQEQFDWVCAGSLAQVSDPVLGHTGSARVGPAAAPTKTTSGLLPEPHRNASLRSTIDAHKMAPSGEQGMTG